MLRKALLLPALVLIYSGTALAQVGGIQAQQTASNPLQLRITDGDVTSTLGTYTFKATNVSLTASATNYVYLDLTTTPPTLTVNTTGFPTSNYYAIATVTTNSKQITAMTDSRPSFNSTAFSAAASGASSQTQVNNNGVLGGTPCQTFASLTNGPIQNNCDEHSKGPNPWADITNYGARSGNPNIAPYALGVTASITSGQSVATLNSASSFVNGDWFVLYGAGSASGLATPSAPTVTNVLSRGGTRTGFVTPSASGSTTTCYKIVAADQNGGYSAASPETCTSTGQATLGPVTVNLSSCSRSGTTITCTTSSSHPVLVNCTPTCGEVFIAGTTDTTFRGWYGVTSAANSTTFTIVNSSLTTVNGASSSTTGGTATFYAANHLVWTPVTGAWIYYIYAGASGAETLYGVSMPEGATNTDYTWEDFGSLMANWSFPPYIPNSPPVAAGNDYLTGQITSGAGTTTVTLSVTASATVSNQSFRLDAGGAIRAAAAACNNVCSLFIPSGNYVVNSYVNLLNASVGVVQSGNLFVHATIAMQNNRWTGWDAAYNQIAGQQPGAWGQKPIFQEGEGAVPGLYFASINSGPVIRNISFTTSQSNGALLVLAEGSFSHSYTYLDFSTGTTSADLMGIGLYLRGALGQSPGSVFLDAISFTAGNTTDGASHNGVFFCNLCGDVHIREAYGTHRGILVAGNSSGTSFQIDNYHYNGGGTPLVTVISSPANNTGVGLGAIIMDTLPHPCVSNTDVLNLASTNLNSCTPSIVTALTGGFSRALGSNGFGGLQPNNVTSGVLGGLLPPSNGSTALIDFYYTGNLFVDNPHSLFVGGLVPAQPSIAVSAGGTLPNATWSAVVVPVFVGGLEGIPSAPSTTVTTTTGNNTVTVTGTALSSGNPVCYRIYFSQNGGAYSQPNSTSTCLSSPSVTFSSLSFMQYPLGATPNGGPSQMTAAQISSPSVAVTSTGGASAESGVFTTARTRTVPDVSGYSEVSGYVNTAYDTFNRANGGLGSNWTTYTGAAGGLSIVSNQVADSTASGSFISMYTGAAFANDQFSQYTVTQIPGAAPYTIVLGVRMNSANGGTMYICNESPGANGSSIARVAGVTATTLTTFTLTPAVGDVLRCEVRGSFASGGNTITFWKNGSVVATFTDSGTQGYDSGVPGAWLFQNAGGTVAFDNWSGGNLHPFAHLDSEQDWTQPQHGVAFYADRSAPCAASQFAISAGWGNTATVSAVAGYGQTCRITITASGTGQAANPTITWTLPVPITMTVSPPIGTAQMTGGTGTLTMISQTTISATAPVWTFQGTPGAGSTYIVDLRMGP